MSIRDLIALEPFVRARMLLQGSLNVAAYLEEINRGAREDMDEHVRSSLKSDEAARAYTRIFEARTQIIQNDRGISIENSDADLHPVVPVQRQSDLDVLHEMLQAELDSPSDSNTSDWLRAGVRKLHLFTVAAELRDKLLDSIIPDIGPQGRHERVEPDREEDISAARS
jgi:Arc/MetJ-type ribon-helix-helix transcriptional regulator